MFDLTGKKALVTGATGGIGEAIARALHRQGATVGLHGTRVEKLETLAGELGGNVKLFPADLGSREAVKELGGRAGPSWKASKTSSTMPASTATVSSCACRTQTGMPCWK